MAKILTVDDSASIRQMVGFTLKKEGHSVVVAEDGAIGLNKAKTEDIDMILCDVNMPNMDGISMVSEVRKLPKCKFIPIIMLTTESQPEMKQKGKNAGATGWIVKPFKPDQLIGVLKKVLR